MIENITFIIASYNDPSIRSTLDSILACAIKGDQILVIDGKSNDRTVEVANDTLNESQVNHTIISEPDDGIYDAWNKGVRLADNTWIAFLGCGDQLLSAYRTEVSAVLKSNKECNFVHHKTQFYKESGGKLKFGRVFGDRLNPSKFRQKMRVCHAGALHHRSLFKDELFSTRYRCVSDYRFLLRALPRLNPCYIDRVLINMDANGISSKLITPYQEELQMKAELGGYSYPMLCLNFAVSVFNAALWKAYTRIRYGV